ncbi:hypothetical protein [Nitrospirillum pindoramense]|uniref:Uncharacterized protein n=1 Tax=Nitrospirillum amazonense TaxID=28077 RepID=A0A560HHB4_9PROT|nr:hypothetical protein [Nitrospirillum amazonense]TWB45836.1 hypothetical protein FBZ90_101171 [Nitrospirillum amazonense]
MRNISIASLLSACLALPAVAAEPTKTLVLGLPADCLGDGVTPVVQLKTALMNAVPGTEVIILDARRDERVADYVVEAPPQGYTPAWTMKRLETALRPVAAHLYQQCRQKGATEDPVGPNDLQLPRFLDDVGRTVFAGRGGAKAIAVIGSARYRGEGDHSFDFGPEPGWPSLGHLAQPPSITPFGTRGREHNLSDVAVDFCTTDQWATERYQAYVQQFESLWIGAMGGTLATFSANIPQCLERWVSATTSGAPVFRDSGKDQAVVMYHLPPASGLGNDPTAFLHTPNTASEPPPTSVGQARVGVTWDCACDIDLYTFIRGVDHDYVYFGHPVGPTSVHLHDYRDATSTDMDTAWEVIQINDPVDLSNLRILINLYSGGGPEVSGRIRLEFQGRVYETTWHLTGKTGNRGLRNGLTPVGTDVWTEIDTLKLAKLK